MSSANFSILLDTTSSMLYRVEKTTISLGISDHDVVTVHMLLKPPRLCRLSRRVFIYSKADFKAISSRLDSFYAKLASRTASDCGASKMWSDFKGTILGAMDDLIPTKMTSTKVHLPWLDNSIKRSIRKKQRLYNKAKRSKDDKDWAAFRCLRNSVDKQIRKSHLSYVSDVIGASLDSAPNHSGDTLSLRPSNYLVCGPF